MNVAAAVKMRRLKDSAKGQWNRGVRAAICMAILFGPSVSASASTSTIISPDHHQTFAYGEMLSHQLYLPRQGNELAARITFSNMPYVSDENPRREESFDFRFPGIKFDGTHRTFFVSNRDGHTIPIARFRDGLFFGWIDLAPGAKIYLLKESGRVTAILTASDHPRAGSQWIESDNNWSLQNILIALFGQPAPGLP
ncbi:MAG TPA: hypothetical protein VGI25_00500 [Candidatus Udaeobacter sp.]|jgi:hypothetical protein